MQDKNKKKNKEEEESKKLPESEYFKVEEDKTDDIRDTELDKQSDKIMQNILNASKLLEGRFTFEQLCNLDIPSFESIVNNEFHNIDVSYKEFKEHGAINAYTKNETTKLDESVLKELRK